MKSDQNPSLAQMALETLQELHKSRKSFERVVWAFVLLLTASVLLNGWQHCMLVKVLEQRPVLESIERGVP